MSDRKGVKTMGRNNDLYNASGCKDPTPYQALRNIEQTRNDEARRLIETIFYIAHLAGFHVEERIVLRDHKTGKIWR